MAGSEIAPIRPQSLLEVLVRHGVDFVLIGGMAGIARGSAYPTYDLDVAYGRDAANLERLAGALRELEVTLRGAPDDLPLEIDARTLSNGANFTFDTEFGPFDVLGDVGGVRSFEELRQGATLKTLWDLPVRVASIDQLIAMKRAANRPKDRLMLEEYVVIADLEDADERGAGP